MNSTFPIFVRAKDCGEMARYASIEEMQREIEAIDIENGEYQAWDGNGLPLKMEVQTPIWLNCVPASSVPKPDELKAAMLGFGAIAGVPIQAEELDSLGVEALFQRIMEGRLKRNPTKSILKRLFWR